MTANITDHVEFYMVELPTKGWKLKLPKDQIHLVLAPQKIESLGKGKTTFNVPLSKIVMNYPRFTVITGPEYREE